MRASILARHGIAFLVAQGPQVRPRKTTLQQQREPVFGRPQQAHGATTVQEAEGLGLEARLGMGDPDLEDGRGSVPTFDRCDPGDGPAMIEGGAHAKVPRLLQLRDAQWQVGEPLGSLGTELEDMLLQEIGDENVHAYSPSAVSAHPPEG